MTIEIYADAVSQDPTEVHGWVGPLGDFMRAQGVAFEGRQEQPIAAFVDGVQVAPAGWDATTVTHSRVQLRVVPHGFDPFTWAIIAAVAAVGVALLMRPKIPGRNNTPQGKNLQTADATGNVAKLNDIVPELAGAYLRYPDYLTPPRRYFADPRTQYMETLLCIGPGQYAVDGNSVKIGNTALAGLTGAEFHLYAPGAYVAAHGMHENWYTAPEVGGTSAGTAGLELSSDVVAGAQLPTGSLTFSGKTITASNGWSEGIGLGTHLSVFLPETYTVTTLKVAGPEASTYISKFSGAFTELEPLVVGARVSVKDGGAAFELIVKTVGGVAGARQVTFQNETMGEVITYSDFVTTEGTRDIKFRYPNRRYSVTAITGNAATVQALYGFRDEWAPDPTWLTFPSGAWSVEYSELAVVGGSVYGKWAGPYVACPVGEASTTFEYDLFFPSGLSTIADNGDLQARGVQVELQHREVGSPAWVSASKTYSAATLDQIGYTERVTVAGGSRREFRLRRTTAAQADTRTNDKVQWYGLRTLLQSPTSYAGWTTIAVRIKGLGDIGASSENRINVLATRMLPTLQADGSWSAPQPTRDISAFFRHIVNSVGYTDAQIDMSELKRLHDIWTARGETLDNVFDLTTVRSALEVCLAAGMADLTLADGLLTPVREGVRTAYDGPPFSAQNTTSEITRTFTTRRPDDNDGVQVEYNDAAENFAPKTVDCKLPGSLGVKLQKIKLPGVTSKTRAWRIGMRAAREMVYRRWAYTLSTELDGLVARYGDYVPLVPDVPDFGQSAIVVGVQGREITSSEALAWQDGRSHVIAWRNPNGSLSGPYAATRIDDNVLQVAGTAPMPTPTLAMEPPHLYFGTLEEWAFPAIVKAVKPQSEHSVEIQAVNYDARIFADDDNLPP